ncbi:outer membrane efflux protein [hydrothermal vent metagenome]|uniref:Outer membrane efflux protein n=1 Tax=hydrothermal vent metagenome TaxID=652676 RepID=A0A1W1CIS6_9ZZZZ
MKLFTYCCIVFVTVLNLQAKEVSNVDELITYALAHAPDLKVSLKQYEAATQRKEQSFGYFLPKVDIKLSAGEMGSSDIPINPDAMKQTNFLLGNISLQQLVYDFGKTASLYDNLKYQEKAFSMNSLQKISDKMQEVKSAYYLTLRAMALIDVAKENLKLNKAQLYRAKRYYAAGIKTKIDISDATVNVIKAKINVKQTQYKLKSAYENLNKVIGIKRSDKHYTVVPQKLKLDRIYETLTPYKYDLLHSIEYAYAHRFTIKSAEELLKVSHANTKRATSEYYPAFYFNADYTKQKENETLKHTIPQDQWQASLNLKWNIYQGGSTVANVQKSIIQEEISQSKLEFLKLKIKKDVTDAYINLNESKDTVELAQALLQASMEKFTQAQKRYENGLSDYIELQQARQNYIDAKSGLVIDYYKYYDALANMYHAIGM